MIFKFDPNSTKNWGRWRLRDPQDFVSKSYITKKYDDVGIIYIMGKLKNPNDDEDDEKMYVQAIRFDKNKWSEKEAAKWWNKHGKKFDKYWKNEDWASKKPSKVSRNEALKIAKSFARKIKIKYIAPEKITIDTEFVKDVLIPIGSARRGREMLGDLDLLITKKIDKKELEKIKDIEILSGGDKTIKIVYKDVRLDLFVFTKASAWGACLMHYTGSFGYNILLRKKAKKLGYKLSQNGLIKLDNNKSITVKTERALHKKLEVRERLPEERDI